jgi:hypothetical protein
MTLFAEMQTLSFDLTGHPTRDGTVIKGVSAALHEQMALVVANPRRVYQ